MIMNNDGQQGRHWAIHSLMRFGMRFGVRCRNGYCGKVKEVIDVNRMLLYRVVDDDKCT